MQRTYRVKNKRIIIIGIAVLIFLSAVNHIVPYLIGRTDRNGGEFQDRFKVQREESVIDHSTIGIDEKSVVINRQEQMLFFSTLAQWHFDPEKTDSCPEAIAAVNGKTVSCAGFMYPLTAGDEVSIFCLLRTTQTCCYGPRPQYNQYLFVEMAEPVRFSRLKPIIIRGKFIIDPQPDEGYIYRLEGTAAEEVEDHELDMNAGEASLLSGYPILDLSLLEMLKNEKNTEGEIAFPATLLALENKPVILEGYLVGNTTGFMPKLIIGKYWWDGVLQGTPPDIYNAVMVFAKNETEVPPLWIRSVLFTGNLRLNREPAIYSEYGILSLMDAVWGVPGVTSGRFSGGCRPCIPIWLEVLIAGGFFLFIFIRAAKEQKKSRE